MTVVNVNPEDLRTRPDDVFGKERQKLDERLSHIGCTILIRRTSSTSRNKFSQ